MRAEPAALLVVGLATLFVGLDVAWAGLAPGLEAPVLGDVEQRWGMVDANRTELLTTLHVRNPNEVPVTLEAGSYTLAGDGLTLGGGQSEGRVVLPPHGAGTVSVRTQLPTESLVAFLEQHLLRGEHSVLTLRGEVAASALGATRRMPFAEERAWDTDTLQSLSTLRGCAGGAAMCVAGVEGAWVPSGQGVALRAVVALRSGLPFAMPLGEVRVALRLAGVTVAQGTGEAGSLPAGGAAEVPLTLPLDPAALRAWWPVHVRGCESSPVRLDVEAQPYGLVALALRDLDAGTMRTHIACAGP